MSNTAVVILLSCKYCVRIPIHFRNPKRRYNNLNNKPICASIILWAPEDMVTVHMENIMRIVLTVFEITIIYLIITRTLFVL